MSELVKIYIVFVMTIMATCVWFLRIVNSIKKENKTKIEIAILVIDLASVWCLGFVLLTTITLFVEKMLEM